MGPLNIPIWLWVYVSLAIVIFILSIPTLLHTPKYLVITIIFSGIIYITGSGIAEAVTYNYSEPTSLVNQIGWFFEDSLEMVGVIFLIYSISRWLNKNKVNLINIKKWLVYLIFAIGFLDLSITFLL